MGGIWVSITNPLKSGAALFVALHKTALNFSAGKLMRIPLEKVGVESLDDGPGVRLKPPKIRKIMRFTPTTAQLELLAELQTARMQGP
jgi:hypothetical protein